MSENTKIAWCDHSRAVPGFPGYMASDDGVIVGPSGRPLRPAGVRPLVVLYRDGKPRTRQVSRIVMETFGGPPPFADACVLHADDNAWNNHVANLRWGTRKENKEDERLNRGRVSGKARRLASVPDADLHFGSAREVAKRFGTSHSVVTRERRRRRG